MSEKHHGGEIIHESVGYFTLETQNYIHDTIAQKLSIVPSNVQSLNLFKEICSDHAVETLSIFSLNHDLVLEELFRSAGMDYIDGFEESEEGIRMWSPQSYRKTSPKVRLYKMHGAIDWMYYRFNHTDTLIRRKPDQAPGRHILHPCPYILIGTDLKLHRYTGGPFADLQCMLLNALHKTDLLIVCGYGYGDRGINHKIFDYCHEAPDKIFVAIGPDLSLLQNDSRYHNARATRFRIPARIEDISWAEIKISIISS